MAPDLLAAPWGIWGPVLGAGGAGSGAPGPDPISSGGGPRVPIRAEILIDRMHVPSIWLQCRVPEGSAGNSLRRFMPGDCWIGWDSVVRTRVFL
jgi:hypothetical protein